MRIKSKEKIASLAVDLTLPHPFDNSLYPYKQMFIDPRKSKLPVLR